MWGDRVTRHYYGKGGRGHGKTKFQICSEYRKMEGEDEGKKGKRDGGDKRERGGPF